MSQHLFDAFEFFETKQWKQLIQYDLKGTSYEDLLHTSPEDITIKPFYNQDDLPKKDSEITVTNSWQIGHDIYVQHEAVANRVAVKMLNEGVNTIRFTLAHIQPNWTLLLKDIHPNTPLIIDSPKLDITEALSTLQKMKFKQVVFNNDCITQLIQEGNWYHNTAEDFKTWLNNTNHLNHFTVDFRPYQNAGGHIIQQLAYGLCHALEYANRLQSGQSTDVYFKVAVGSYYFLEIAKFRALRILWRKLAKVFELNPDCKIIAEPSKRNKTIYDFNNNLLRATTECMSAAIGGADIIFNTPYDAHFKKSHDFSSRLSKNQLLILKHEGYFDKVSNPADGAYYIESLTKQIAEKALQLIKDIEAKGGLLKMFFEGTIQRKIKEQANKELQKFNDKNITLTGVNIYEDETQTMKSNMELYPFIKTKPRKTLIEPLMQKRLAEEWEQNRLKHE